MRAGNHIRCSLTERQVIVVVRKHEISIAVGDLCRETDISKGTFYNWRSQYAGTTVSDVKRMEELESENKKLKHMYVNKL